MSTFQAYQVPGVYLEEYRAVRRQQMPTAVPAFLGYVRRHEGTHFLLRHWAEFVVRFGEPLDQGYLAYAVRGFFENGGKLCYVIPLSASGKPEETLRAALRQVRKLEDPDLVCVPDLMITPAGEARHTNAVEALQAVLLHAEAERSDEPRRFLILDSLPKAKPEDERKHCAGLIEAARRRGASPADLADAALYYPWVAVPRLQRAGEPPAVGESVPTEVVPPCGHVAGIYARTDESAGISKAPANEALHGVLDLSTQLSDSDQAGFFVLDGGEAIPPGAVNCVRAFPGRGIRVWGARTLASDPAWRYVNVRRLFLTAIRWMERYMASLCFEPHNEALEARVRRELNDYCYGLFRRGALKGATTKEAFYVRCDENTNPQEVRDAGMIVAEVGLAAARPHEFIVIRLIQRQEGTTTTTGASADSL
jgi:phage tail sheath protein FI